MRCPAIEGIETRSPPRRPAKAGVRRVECVAPLLRGLKPSGLGAFRSYLTPRRMRCPAIEGIETRDNGKYLTLD